MNPGTIVVPIAPHHRPYWHLHCQGFGAALSAITAAAAEGAGPATCAYVARRHLAHPVWANWALAMLGLAEPLILPLTIVAGRACLPLALPERPGFILDALMWPSGPGPWRFGWNASSLCVDRPIVLPDPDDAESPPILRRSGRRFAVGSLWTAGMALLLGAPAVLAGEVPYRPVRGETMRQVAERLWGDATGWRSLWAVNRDRVPNPGFLVPDWGLRIPDHPGHPGPQPANPVLVRASDTLWDLAGRIYGDSLAWPILWGWNRDHISNPHWIFPDQPVHWHLHGTLHIVRHGETLRTIAKVHWGTDRDWVRIWQMNRGWLTRPDRLPVFARVWVPDDGKGGPRNK